jgi:hypothetical protein
MPRRPSLRKPATEPRQRRARKSVGASPALRQLQRWLQLARGMPAFMQVGLLLTVGGLLWLALNWTYQVVRKPSELFFPVSGALYKTPAETWQQYGALFQRHSTAIITPELLAALAQVEGSGNPVVRTYWRWSLSSSPFDVYRPASSAVGMYQMTNGTFAQARRLCIHDHAVVEDGPWHAWRSCWFTSLYTRVIPSHAVELTSAHLDRSIQTILAQRAVARPSVTQQQELAALIHLCGAAAGARHAQRRFRLPAGQRCGNHDVQRYLNGVSAMQRLFSTF